jgi:hypothetical protein
MANKKRSITKAERSLVFNVPSEANSEGDGSLFYIDIARELSKANRKLFSQTRCYGIESVEFWFTGAPTATSILVQAATASDNWVVNNAHVKGHALWKQMNDLVLLDNPSIKPKWQDFKVRLDGGHTAARQLQCRDGADQYLLNGQWDYSTYVMPQHEVDPATGLPLPADEVTAVLIGGDTATKRSLVEAYALSRATVQPNDPSVPAGMSTSFFNLLTDSGSQEPELADVIEDENDQPPYDQAVYPGQLTNANIPMDQGVAVATIGSPMGYMGAFTAPCGLIRFKCSAFDANGDAESNNAAMIMKVNLLIGKYKGIASVPMGQ